MAQLSTTEFPKYRVLDFVPQPAQNTIQSLLYLKQINRIACLYSNGLVTLFDTNTHLPVKSFKAHFGSITTVAFLSKRLQLVTQYGGEIKIWDLSQARSTEVNQVNVDFSVVNSMEVISKKNCLIVAGELRCLRRAEKFDTLYYVDLGKGEIKSQWKDSFVILTTTKIRYGKDKYLLGCGFANGYFKLLSLAKENFNCVLSVRAHKGELSQLHTLKINNHPLCVSESSDKMIKLWNVGSKLVCLRKIGFRTKTNIVGSLKQQKIVVLFEELGAEISFLNILTGMIVQKISLGVQKIRKGILFGKEDKVMLVLEVPQFVYLGIKDK